MKNKYITLGLIFLVLFLFCEQKIPEGPERSEILEINLSTRENRTEYAQENNWDTRYKLPPKWMSMDDFQDMSTWEVPFTINAYNGFDEAIEGKKWIHVKLNIWPADEQAKWRTQLTYADTSVNRNLVIPPGDDLTIIVGNQLIWTQKDSAGNSIHATKSFEPIWIECTMFDSVFKNPNQTVPWRYCDTTKLAPVDTVMAFGTKKKFFAQAEVQLFKNYHVVKSNIFELDIHYYYPVDGFKKKFWCVEGKVIQGDPPCPFGRP